MKVSKFLLFPASAAVLGGLAALAAPAGTGAELLHGAWIAPELGSPDQTEPTARPDAAASEPIATAGAPSKSAARTPAAVEATPKSSASETKTAPGDGTSLRERLAARSYKSDANYGKTAAAAGSAGTFAGKHTDAFTEALKKIDEMAKAKASNPSQAVGPYQGGDAALKNASELPPKGYGYAYVQGTRGTNFGTDQMVFGLMETFALMADLYPDGVENQVGDIGKQSGGPLAPHVSHRTGRDVDLCLFGVTGNGKSVNAWNSYDAQGMAGAVKFDAARNWDFACTLLECKRWKVVFILVYQPLKDLLIAHAKERLGKAKSDAEAQLTSKLIKEAENQIRDVGTGHNNHYHLRIE